MHFLWWIVVKPIRKTQWIIEFELYKTIILRLKNLLSLVDFLLIHIKKTILYSKSTFLYINLLCDLNKAFDCISHEIFYLSVNLNIMVSLVLLLTSCSRIWETESRWWRLKVGFLKGLWAWSPPLCNPCRQFRSSGPLTFIYRWWHYPADKREGDCWVEPRISLWVPNKSQLNEDLRLSFRAYQKVWA